MDGKRIEQPLTVRMDPRVKTPAAGLAEQFKLSMLCYDGVMECEPRSRNWARSRKQLEDRKAKAADWSTTIDAIDAKLTWLSKGQRVAKGNPQPPTAGGKPGPGRR